MDGETITAISVGIIGPIIAYLKIRDERLKTGDKRDTQTVLIEKRLGDCESKLTGLDEVKLSVNALLVSLSRIETMIEMHIKWTEKDR